MKKSLLIFFLLVILTALTSKAQENYWTTAAPSSIGRTAPDDKFFKLEMQGFKAALQRAPQREGLTGKSNTIMSFPNNDGTFEQFRIVVSSSLDPELAAKYPEINAYAGQGVDDPTATIRFSVSDYDGFNGVILSASRQTIMIKPMGDGGNYRVFKQDVEITNSFTCGTPVNASKEAAIKELSSGRVAAVQAVSDKKFRKYRVALSCGAEYGNLYAGSGTPAQMKARILAQMNTIITRINSIYERELSVTLQVISGTDQMIFFGDVTADPWPDFYQDTSTWLNYNTICQQVMSQYIPVANYDLGHHFNVDVMEHTDAGSAGCIACSCQTNSKGLAFSIGGDPSNDMYPFVIAHEMGHQMGAYHTQSSAACISGNHESEVEPGGGNTIMSYAAFCQPTMQKMPDAYFNYISIKEITSYIYAQSCGSPLALTNNPPTANAGLDYTIPKSTPFVLTGQGSDPDGNALTYTWEQEDAQDYDALDKGTPPPSKVTGPVIRSIAPSSSPVRSLPNASFVIANLPNVWEVLASVSRTLNFAFSVRDNAAGGGQVASDLMVVNVSNTGPFRVSSNNAPLVWTPGSNATVTWDVAGTNGAPVNCANVKISLSTDGGLTFPTVLAASTPNDGSQAIVVPTVTGSTHCRVKIESINNIFYDISDADFSITQSGCVASVPSGLFQQRLEAQGATLSWVRGNNSSYEFHYRVSGNNWITQTVADQPGNYYMSTVLTGLSVNAFYEAQVRSVCTSTGTNSTIIVRARGTSGQEHINLRVNNNLVGSTNLNTTMQNYTFTTTATGGITVQFDNDATNRDVQVDYIQVNGTIRQAEAQTYNTGVYVNNACGGSNSEWLHCNGLIGFGDVTGGTGGTTTYSDWSPSLFFFTGSLAYNTEDINSLLAIDRNCDKTNMLNWNTSSDFSSWAGVTWSAASPKRALKLDVGFMGLTGVLDAGTMDQLTDLSCAAYNQLTGIKLGGATGLQHLNCGGQLQQLDLSAQRSLLTLDCRESALTSINFGTINQLQTIDLRNNFLTALNLNSLVNLTDIEGDNNYLTSFDASRLTSLQTLDLPSNALTSITVANHPALTRVVVSNNKLTSINLTNSLKMFDLTIDNNKLTTITGLATLPLLGDINAQQNKLTTLDVTKNSKMTSLLLDNNALTSITLPTTSILKTLTCASNVLTTLSLTTQTNLENLWCYDNKLSSFTITGTRIPMAQFIASTNNLPFSQLYKMNVDPSVYWYEYAPQNEVFQPVNSNTDVVINYSSEAVVGDTQSSFTFYKEPYIAETNNTGVFTTTGPGIYYCVMTNPQFPLLTLTSAKTNIGNVIVTPASSLVNYFAQGIPLTIHSSAAVTVTSNQSWATYSGITDDGTNRVAWINVSQNSTVQNRTVNITFTFTNPSRVQTVTITQQVSGGISDYSSSDASTPSVHPNPATSVLHVGIPPSPFAAQLTLYSMTGNSVLEKTNVMGEVELDVHGLKPGIYVLKIITSEKAFEQRVVIQP